MSLGIMVQQPCVVGAPIGDRHHRRHKYAATMQLLRIMRHRGGLIFLLADSQSRAAA
eukprot:COSAG01_NODE_20151_length_968_cov_0.881473_2_plen_56_part_01